jgi:hypothetical protein
VQRKYIAILMGLLSACSTVPISHGTSSVPLTQAVHFSSPDGSEAVAPPGVYQVERVEPTVLKLIPGEGGKQQAVTVQAMPTEHKETISAPFALSIPYKEDEHHIVLLTPDGKALDAIGTYSGVRSRAAQFPLPTKALTPYARLLLSLTLNPNSIVGGSAVTGIVSLDHPAPGNGIVVGLSSNSGSARVPSAMIIAGGQTQATFPIQTATVPNTTSVIISAGVAGITRTAPLMLRSMPFPQCPTYGGAPCTNQGACNAYTGLCTCYTGFTGSGCQYSSATTCNGQGTVDYNGVCTCVQGFTGQYCNIPVQ